MEWNGMYKSRPSVCVVSQSVRIRSILITLTGIDGWMEADTSLNGFCLSLFSCSATPWLSKGCLNRMKSLL